MGELAAPLEGVQEESLVTPLESTQLQMMRLLQINKDRINEQERIVLDQLETRYRDGVNGSIESLISAHPTITLPVFNESDLEVVKRGGHLSLPKKLTVKKEDRLSVCGRY
ncbi:hypothetical protein ANCCAN_20460 [Ancylostoma caninum]|uniref:Uncharacterized protein n=1 Tax=Ancylostoma caninum TaxID=29170 RepID=A0A368FSA3_ANCCA|nr:hypothetical protein ANCCAN_20460 [Ancylostoma caninum]